jgi:tetratricopeptide (TPR) repeat protein
VHIQRVNIGVGQEESLEKAEAFASRALYLASELPHGHLVLGLTAIFRVMTKAAIEHFRHALAAEPNNPDALRWLGMFCAYLGKSHEALALSERAIAIDPMVPRMPFRSQLPLCDAIQSSLAVLACGPVNR